jgi:bacterioferritin-associated ferredoxin
VIVCMCYGVSDRKICQLAAEGACTVDDVTARCGAGGDCGGCRESIKELVETAVEEANQVKAA